MNVLKAVCSKCSAVASKWYGKTFVAVAFGTLAIQSQAADLVSVDAATGEVTFDPTAIIGDIRSAIVATILATVSITVIIVGYRWMKRLVKTA